MRSQKKRLLTGHICMINIMGSPGAGKTSLITALIGQLKDRFKIGVIEGDIAGQVDADRIASLGIPAVQLNTDGACHIEAMSIQHILPYLPLDDLGLLFLWKISAISFARRSFASVNLANDHFKHSEGDDRSGKISAHVYRYRLPRFK